MLSGSRANPNSDLVPPMGPGRAGLPSLKKPKTSTSPSYGAGMNNGKK